MRTTLLFVLALQCLFPLWSQDYDVEEFIPFQLATTYTSVMPAHFRTEGAEGTIRYRELDCDYTYLYPLTPRLGLIFGTNFQGCEVNWRENPDFQRTHFQYIGGSMGVFTDAFPCWIWSAKITALLDTQELNIKDYALYDGILWGKYALNGCSYFHGGFIFEAGLNKGKIWPILGFEYFPSERWKVHAVYPLNVACEYYFIPDVLSVGPSLRFLRTRHRLKNDEVNAMGIFQYQSTGAELFFFYQPFALFQAEGFVGTTISGDLKISNRNDDDATHYKFKRSLYLGGSLFLMF